MIVDTSIILAIFFEEPHAAWATEQLNAHQGTLSMSTVNLAETLILLRDRTPKLFNDLENTLLGSGIQFISPDIEQARIAAEARLKYPLNPGDCFAYALSVVNNAPILTLDRDFRSTDQPVLMP